MSKSAKKRPMASAPAAVPTTKSSRHSAGDPEPKRADRGSKQSRVVALLQSPTGATTTVGGIPFTRGPLAHLLRNRFYIGEVPFKGEVLHGEQPPILDRDLFDAVQAKLSEQTTNHRTTRMNSEALLTGRIFDDRGNRMSPSHVRKGGLKYRYYLSSALFHGAAERAGSVRRVPAADIEALVIRSVREHLKPSQEIDDRSLVHTHVARVEVQPEQLVIQLAEAQGSDRQKAASNAALQVSWQKTISRRRRAILCLMECRRNTPGRYVRKIAPPWSHRSPAPAANDPDRRNPC